MIQTKKIEYRDGENILEGYLAYDDRHRGKRPAVLVFPDWSGRNDFACQKAEKLAELGYIGFAADIYGKGKIGKTTEEKAELMTPFKTDRRLLRRRLIAAFDTVDKMERVNNAKIAAIGFCFGGLCALELARSGVDVRGVVSFHGLLDTQTDLPNEAIQAKILALHGHDDPMVTPAQVTAFQNEMTQAKVDWQMHIYSKTMHAFTNPLANDPGFGTVYNPLADKRSWIAMKEFFTEILG